MGSMSSTGTHSSWTATRCARLLRPLSSRITALRKLRKAETQKATVSSERERNILLDGSDCFEASSAYANNLNPAPCNGPSTLADSEENWESSPRPRKKIRRTYSSRAKGSRIDADTDSTRKNTDDTTQRPTLHVPAQLLVASRDSHTQAIQSSHDMEQTQEASEPEVTSNLARSSSARPLSHPKTSLDPSRRAILNMAQQMPREQWTLVYGIFTGLSALLKATHRDSEVSKVGCRSLFSTCLKAMPDYISEEQLLVKIEDPDNDVDISSAVYGELEDFGPLASRGWNSLRELVRAHGLRMLGDAIKDRLIDLDIAKALVSFCVRQGAHDEAQTLVEGMLALLRSDNIPSSITTPFGDHMLILRTMQMFASGTGRRWFLYKCVATIIEDNVLPTWVVSGRSMSDCWNGVIQSLAQQDDHARQAAILLRSAVKKSCGLTSLAAADEIQDLRKHFNVPDSVRFNFRSSEHNRTTGRAMRRAMDFLDIQNLVWNMSKKAPETITNALTALLSISIIQHSRAASTEDESKQPCLTLLREIAMDVCQSLEMSSYNHGPMEKPCLILDGACLPLLAAGLATTMSRGSSAQLSVCNSRELDTLARLPSNSGHATKAGSFIRAVAHCCQQVASMDAFDVVQQLVQRLMRATSTEAKDSSTPRQYGEIAVAAAFAYSEDTRQPSHLDWALDVERDVNTKGGAAFKSALDETPARGATQAKSIYKWEEGICEWIARTPAIALPKPSSVFPDPDYDDELATRPATYPEQESALPTLSELSPCSRNRRPLGKLDKNIVPPMCLRAMACKPGSRKSLVSLLSVRKVCDRNDCGKPSTGFQKIAVDDEADELSTPGSSQETTDLREPPDVLRTTKSNRSTTRRASLVRRVSGSLFRGPSCPDGSRRSQVISTGVEQENQDTEDELNFP